MINSFNIKVDLVKVGIYGGYGDVAPGVFDVDLIGARDWGGRVGFL